MTRPKAEQLEAPRQKTQLLLEGACAPQPYIVTQLLADLGRSPNSLSTRSCGRMKKTMPIPCEQQILWADVEMGTRTHGVVLTDAGVFFKDGPADDDEDAPEAVGADGIEIDGLGYRYVRWENFDPARVSHMDGAPTFDGERFLDPVPFKSVAMACVRINNVRIRARRAGKAAARDTHLLSDCAPRRSVCRSSSRSTLSYCFDEEGLYRFYTNDGLPKLLEVPADQYDAVLQAMRMKIAGGRVPGIDDPDLVGAFVVRGSYTYLQAVNIAKAAGLVEVKHNPRTGSVVCRDECGLDSYITQWLEERSRLGAGVLRLDGEWAHELSGVRAEMLANGARVQADAQTDPAALAGSKAARMVAGGVASTAGYTVGATGARAVLAAVGMAGGPLAMVASFIVGDACGKAGVEAFSMAHDLFVEPQARVMGRLFDGVLWNVAFEHALTNTERALLAELIARVDPAVLQGLGASLKGSEDQEGMIREMVEPMVWAVRQA